MKNHHRQSLIPLLFVSLFVTSISGLPHFFPNISSIPPSLIPNLTAAGAWDAFQNFAGCHLGDKVNGLAKMKKYFQYFGYINNSSLSFTDDFDEILESAIKTYQLNFNLNVTGVLDDPTIKQISKPRCGNADVINRTSSMKSGKTPSSSPIHLHTVAHYSFFPGSPRWPRGKTQLTYSFLPENQLIDTVKVVFSRAFDRWSAVIPLTFTETAAFFSADIRIGFFSGDHGDGEPFDGILGTLAHAFSPPSGRFHLDIDENWIVDGDFTSNLMSAVDLESVAVHEIGHLLGLGHSSIEEAIMYPTISSVTRKVELAADDIAGIQVLYGSNPDFNGSVTPSSQERDTGGNSGAHSVGPLLCLRLLLAFGLLLFIL